MAETTTTTETIEAIADIQALSDLGLTIAGTPFLEMKTPIGKVIAVDVHQKVMELHQFILEKMKEL